MTAMWKIPTTLTRLAREEIGQSMVEYVIATGAAVLASYFILILFHRWLSWYYYDAAALISLPIP